MQELGMKKANEAKKQGLKGRRGGGRRGGGSILLIRWSPSAEQRSEGPRPCWKDRSDRPHRGTEPGKHLGWCHRVNERQMLGENWGEA